jgi:hypothetical protein
MQKLVLGIALVSIFAGGCALDTEPDAEAISEALRHVDRDRDPLIEQDGPLTEWLYEQLNEGWTRWALELPWSTGPVNDPTGESCGLDQRGPVFYLAGTSGGSATRSCTIPRHKFLFFPLVNFWLAPPPARIDTPEEMAEFLAFAETFFPAARANNCGLTLRVDGEEVRTDLAELDEDTWTDVFDPFAVTLDEDNFTGGPGGLRPAVLTGGHFALLRPLSRGPHTVEFGGVVCTDGVPDFETSVAWEIEVE